MAIQNNFPAIKPTLLLDFANTKALDPRITFTRASTAAFYDGVTTAKAEENLLLQSQTLDNASWTSTNNTVVANAAAAPDGTTTAASLTASAANGTTTQSITAIAGDYTFSIWLRRVTGTGNIDISAHSGGTWVTQTITSTWARYTVTQTLTAGVRTPGIRIVTSGDAIEAWGAQLEQRSAATAYTATTTAPITNYIPVLRTAAAGVARFEHNPVTGESLGLEIEEQRTNLVTYSEQFDNAAWTKQQSSITANTAIAPDGALAADAVIQNTANNAHGLTGTIAVTSGTTYTWSVFAKAQASTVLQLTFGNASSTFSGLGYANFNLSAGTVSATGGTLVGSGIQDVGNGWYRCFITATATATATSNSWITVANSTTYTRLASYTGDGYSGIYIWGAQLEAGAFPTSYIPTVASQVTRAADAASMTGTNFSSWYNAAGGTVYAEAYGVDGSGGRIGWAMSDNSFNNSAYLLMPESTDSISLSVVNGGVGQVSIGPAAGTFVGGTFYKTASAVKFNDSALCVNAGTVSTDTSCTMPNRDRFFIGSNWTGNGNFLNGIVRKIAYYPLRVTNAQLQALTS